MQGLRFAGEPGATIVVPDIGVSGHGINFVGLGYNVIACEPDEHKYRKQIELVEIEAAKILARVHSPITLPSALMLCHKDNERLLDARKHKFWPVPQFFVPWQQGATVAAVKKHYNHVNCLKVTFLVMS